MAPDSSPPPAEGRLWSALRELGGRFRRQAPFGPFILDFVSHQARLIVQVEGEVEPTSKGLANDLARERWLGQRGYRLLRFPASQVLQNTDAVLARIAAELRERTPTPTNGNA